MSAVLFRQVESKMPAAAQRLRLEEVTSMFDLVTAIGDLLWAATDVTEHGDRVVRVHPEDVFLLTVEHHPRKVRVVGLTAVEGVDVMVTVDTTVHSSMHPRTFDRVQVVFIPKGRAGWVVDHMVVEAGTTQPES